MNANNAWMTKFKSQDCCLLSVYADAARQKCITYYNSDRENSALSWHDIQYILDPEHTYSLRFPWIPLLRPHWRYLENVVIFLLFGHKEWGDSFGSISYDMMSQFSHFFENINFFCSQCMQCIFCSAEDSHEDLLLQFTHVIISSILIVLILPGLNQAVLG